MNGLPPVIKEELEEIRDEDLPVLPYKSKNKKIINIEDYVSKKSEKELKNKNSLEELKKDSIKVESILNKDVIHNENIISKNVIQNEESIIENITPVEKSINKDLIKEDEFKDKKLEEKKRPKKEGLNFDQINKEYDEMFPPLRPEDYN